MSLVSQVFSYKSRSQPVQLQPVNLDPSLGPDDVLIDTKYVALNPADIKIKSMAFVPWKYHTGRDFGGIVMAAGANANERFPPGTSVCGNHQLGSATVGSVTKINTKKHVVMKAPATLTAAEAAGIPAVFGTAYAMTRACERIDPDSAALVLGGASSVGSILTQLLTRELKVRRVVTTCSPKSAKYSQSLGAHQTIDYHEPSYREQLVAAAGPEKFQNVFDCVGGYDAIAVADRILQPASQGSTYVTCAGDSPFEHAHSKAMLGFLGSLPRMVFRSIFGKQYGINYKFTMLGNKDWPELAPGLIDRYKIKVPIDSVYEASNVDFAFTRLDEGGVRGKVVLAF